VWPDTLSGRLPVVALVGHHPTNKLIGRGPIPHRKSFPPQPMQAVVLSGIRPSFPGLSQSAGQITHVLLTRSPLESLRRALSVRLACVKHAASVRPEPESNSPNKNQKGSSEQSDLTKTPKTGIQKNHTPKREKEMRQKQQQTKTTKHTIEFSNNTPALQATLPLYSTWTETSNLVRQSIWTGAVGFSIKTTPCLAQPQTGLPTRGQQRS
jgi:hypothetical protein